MRNPLVRHLPLLGLAFIFAAASVPFRATEPVRNEVKEALLSLKVRTKLLNHLHSGAVPIRVSSEGRTVTLTGEVFKKSDRKLAGSVAKSVSGVKYVKNEITVTEGVHADHSAAAEDGNAFKDALLVTRIKTRLVNGDGASSLKLNVDCTNGVVSLSGTPADQAHHDNALRITRQTKGVTQVHDLMKIKVETLAGR